MFHLASKTECSNCRLIARPPKYRDAGGFQAYQAAATDKIQISVRPGLSDGDILRRLAKAVAQERCADRCLMLLAAIQAKAEKHGKTRAHTRGMPQSNPPPGMPPRPSAPPQDKPPNQPAPPSGG